MSSPQIKQHMRLGDESRCVVCGERLTALEQVRALTQATGSVCHRPRCRWTHNALHARGGALCSVCSAPISDFERRSGGVCRQQACRHEKLNQDLCARAREQQIVLEQRARHTCRRLAANWNLSASLPVVLVPYNGRAITNLPHSRRRAIRDHLQQVISRAAAQWYGPRTDACESRHDPPGEPLLQSDLAILGNACAVCRGQCCWAGRDNAFIDEETIRRYWKHNPTARPNQILEHYLSLVGHKTYRNSCFYHGQLGCLLPREMRPRLCNEFLCVLLKTLLARIEDEGFEQCYAVSVSQQQVNIPVSDQKFQRVALIDSQKCQLLDYQDDPIGKKQNRNSSILRET